VVMYSNMIMQAFTSVFKYMFYKVIRRSRLSCHVLKLELVGEVGCSVMD